MFGFNHHIRPMRHHFAHHSRTLLREQGGVTAIEFAFITPVVLLLVMGIVEFAMIMFVMASMESATALTARTGKTGYAPAGVSRVQQITNSINSHTAGLLNPGGIHIDYTIYPSFEKVDQPEPYTDSNGNGNYDQGEPFTDVNGNATRDLDMGLTGVGNAGDVVVYTVYYDWPVMTPIIKPILGSTFRITVRTVIKNEPFG